MLTDLALLAVEIVHFSTLDEPLLQKGSVGLLFNQVDVGHLWKNYLSGHSSPRPQDKGLGVVGVADGGDQIFIKTSFNVFLGMLLAVEFHC